MRDTYSDISFFNVFETNSVVGATTVNTAPIDLTGSASCKFFMQVGGTTSIVGLDFYLEESDDNVTFTTVDANHLTGTLAGTAITSFDTVSQLGYIGSKRYVRAVINSLVGNNVIVSMHALVDNLRSSPFTVQAM